MTERLTIPAHRTDVEMTQIVFAQPRQQPRHRLGGQMSKGGSMCALQCPLNDSHTQSGRDRIHG